MPTPRGWTDQQLIDAVADPDVTTMRQLYRKLGLRPSGGAWKTVRRHAHRLKLTLPVAEFTDRSWTDDQLRAAVPGATSMLQITNQLGLTQSGAENDVIRRHARRLGLTLPDGRKGRR